MVKMTRVASVTTLVGIALGISTLAVSPVHAFSTSDKAAAILYWPKVLVDASAGVDTRIRMANTDTANQKQAHCYYIDANSHCSNNPTKVCHGLPFECGAGSCVPGWMEIDFDVVLTFEQPLEWRASHGLSRSEVPKPAIAGVCLEALPAFVPCLGSSPGCTCNFGQTNAGTGVPPVPEEPFIGSLQCIQYAPAVGSAPARPDNLGSVANGNKLIGQATLEALTHWTDPAGVVHPVPDLASYNAVGIRYKAPAAAGIPSNELHLDGVQYDSCPTSLVLDHIFDFVGPNETTLTLVPCGNNLAAQIPGSATAQFLVFNEFEQRFSTTRNVPCFLDSVLSRLDTTNQTRSIFSWNISGTAAGQTRIKPVGTASTGRGLLGVAVLDSAPGHAAYNLHQNGSPVFVGGTGPVPQPDIITLP